MWCPGARRSVCAMARPDFPRSLAELQSRFATEEDCRRYLVACRWPDGFRCPRCGAREAHEVAERELGRDGYEAGGVVLHKRRGAIRRRGRDRLSGVVEVDEAYVGGVEEGRRG